MSLSTILALLLGGGVLLYVLLYACLRLEDRATRWLTRGTDRSPRPEPDLSDIVTDDGSIGGSTVPPPHSRP